MPVLTERFSFVPSGISTTTYVPEASVFNAAIGTYVVVEMPDGTKENRPVKTGIYSDDYVEILDGLIEGETVSISYTATQPQVMMMGGGHPPM